MRYDKDLAVFGKHFDWYKVVYGVGYVPTDKAPEYAKTAMDNYNDDVGVKSLGLRTLTSDSTLKISYIAVNPIIISLSASM